jgi:hypothetical protein
MGVQSQGLKTLELANMLGLCEKVLGDVDFERSQ